MTAPPRILEEMNVGNLRRLLHADLDEGLTISAALDALAETDRLSAAHDIDTRQYHAYVDRREARRAEALAEAAAASDRALRGRGDGERMAGRQTARGEAAEAFGQREPLLDFNDWVQHDRPEVYEGSELRRGFKAVTSALVH